MQHHASARSAQERAGDDSQVVIYMSTMSLKVDAVAAEIELHGQRRVLTA